MLDIRLGCESICKRVVGHIHWEFFFWRRNISFRFGQFVSLLTEAIFSFNFWETASIVSLGEAKNGFIFGINFWLRVWNQNLSFLAFVAGNSRLTCVGRDRMRAEWVVAALLWFYKHDSDSFALKQIPCHRLLHDGVSMSWHMLPRRGFKTMQRNCRGTSKCLQSCWGLEKLVLVSWKCHAVAWHHGLYEIWRQACQWFGFAFRLCSWSCMLAPRKSMQADLHAARSPYVLIICSLPVVFVCNALFLFLLLYFHMYKLQTNLVNVCAQLISLRNEHFFWWHLRCAVFSYVQTPGILWKHLCAAHSIGESHAMTTPSICCVFICTNPNQTSILGSGRNLQLPRAKKEINWTFL